MPLPDLNYQFDQILLGKQDEEIEESKTRIAGKYYPSEIPYCIRKSYYGFFHPKKNPASALRMFEAGNMTHEWINRMLKELVEKKQLIGELTSLENEVSFNIVVDVDEDISISGRYDNFLMLNGDERYLIEVKSQKSLFYTNDYKKEHAIQAMPYIYIKRPCKGVIIYVDRQTYETRVFPKEPTMGLEYDPQVMKYIFQRIKLLDTYIKTHVLPPPEAKQNKDMNWQCGFCSWKIECDAADAAASKWIKK